jgi:hypothetical protein
LTRSFDRDGGWAMRSVSEDKAQSWPLGDVFHCTGQI